jgi:endonuclease/exonuclease/phosphatase family metal-dependent hydrolase
MDENSPQQPGPGRRRLRLMTYNVHSCRGTDLRCDPARIAEVIARHEPDIVGLQELDVGRRRTGGADQAQAIAMHLRMKSHFHPALNVAEELYGDAILTPLPSRLVKAGPLPSIGEPRGALWVSIEVDGCELDVFNTHLGLRRRERMRQVQALLGPSWLGHPTLAGKPIILMGDFNAGPRSAPFKLVAGKYPEAQDLSPARPRPTFPSLFPMLRIDHIFLRGVEVLGTEVVNRGLARRSSDHLPLIATVALP